MPDKLVKKYLVVAKTDKAEHHLESYPARLQAEQMAEAYATGKEACFTLDVPAMQEQPGHPIKVFIPVHRLQSVYVTPVEGKES